MSLRKRARRLRRKARAAMTPQNIARIGTTAFLGPIAGPLVADFVLEGSLPNVRDLTNPATLASFAGVDPKLVNLASGLIQNGEVDFKGLAEAAGVDPSLVNNINDLKNLPGLPDNIKNALDKINDIEGLFDVNLSENQQLAKLQNIFDNSNNNILLTGDGIIKKVENIGDVFKEQKNKLPKNWNVSYLSNILPSIGGITDTINAASSVKGALRSTLATGVNNFLPAGLQTDGLNFSTSFGRNKLLTATQNSAKNALSNLNSFLPSSVQNINLGFFRLRDQINIANAPIEQVKTETKTQIENSISTALGSSTGVIYVTDPTTTFEYLNIVSYDKQSFDNETNTIIEVLKSSPKDDISLVKEVINMY